MGRRGGGVSGENRNSCRWMSVGGVRRENSSRTGTPERPHSRAFVPQILRFPLCVELRLGEERQPVPLGGGCSPPPLVQDNQRSHQSRDLDSLPSIIRRV